MSKLKIILFVIVLAAVAVLIFLRGGNSIFQNLGMPGLGGLPGFEWVEYEAGEPLASVPGGNFVFRYPSLFEIKTDTYYIDQLGERHAVILAYPADAPYPIPAELIEEGAVSVFEVNVAKGPNACAEAGYDACEVKGGVALGIKSKDRRILELLPEIVASFEVLPRPQTQ